MTFKESVETCLKKKYCQFSGRASRSEYWYFYLFYLVASLICNVIDEAAGLTIGTSGINSTILGLALLLPQLGAGVRRLHDSNHSGWNLLWSLTIIGIFYVLYLLIIEGNKGTNKYGQDPLGWDDDDDYEDYDTNVTKVNTDTAGGDIVL